MEQTELKLQKLHQATSSKELGITNHAKASNSQFDTKNIKLTTMAKISKRIQLNTNFIKIRPINRTNF